MLRLSRLLSLSVVALAAWPAAGACVASQTADPALAPATSQDASSDVHWLDGPPPSPEGLREHPEIYADLLAEQGLVIDFEAGRVSARGGTLHDRETLGYPIEYVLVTDRGRTHEALLVIKARPSVLDACLRAIGLDAGSPMRFRLRDEEDVPAASGDASSGAAERETQEQEPRWDAVPAFGPLVAIDVAWTDDDGRPHRNSLESMLLDVRSGEPLPERDWVYVGGRFGPLRQGRRVYQVHVADLNGNVVAIYLDGQGLCLLERNSLEGVDDTLYTIHPEHAPRRGTPVTVVFTVTGEHVEPPPPTRDDVLRGDLAAALDQVLELAAARGFCGVVELDRAGRTELRKAYGSLAARGAPLPTDAVFPLGGVGRRLIATAVLEAAATGAFSLDDVLARHVRDVPPDKAGVRMRHLLEDTSGMPVSVPGAETIDRARALKALLAAPLLTEPGERCEPSRAGYALLLIALENAAEDVWRGLLGERVLARARMADTGLWGEPRWDGARLARGTVRRGDVLVDVGTPADRLPTWQEQGGGAIMVSVRDLARYERALAEGVLSDLATGFTPPCELEGDAWRVEGFRVESRTWPGAELVLVVASNVEEPDVLPELVELIAAAAGAEQAAAGGR
jgi:CubicO group peptidase (beta-lactamase class C family)